MANFLTWRLDQITARDMEGASLGHLSGRTDKHELLDLTARATQTPSSLSALRPHNSPSNGGDLRDETELVRLMRRHWHRMQSPSHGHITHLSCLSVYDPQKRVRQQSSVFNTFADEFFRK